MKATPVRRTRRKSRSQARAFFRHAEVHPSAFFTPADLAVQRKCEACEAEENTPQRKETGTAPSGPARSAARYVQTRPGRGEPMPGSVRAFFGSRMGANLDSVRIHHDAEAAQSAAQLHAQAYTVGENIVFNRGKYAPETHDGRRLLAHELVHVVQQRNQRGHVQMMPEETQAPADEKKDKGLETGKSAPPEKEKDAGATAEDQEKAADIEGEKIAQPVSLPDFSTFGKRSVHSDFATNVTFKGQTDATFDGGTGQTKNLKGVPAKGCSGCDDSECFTVTGTLQINYHVSTSVTLPEVPSGLTPCQEKRVRDAINTKLKPHEDKHVAAFETYNGTVNLPINYTGCKAGLADFVQVMHDADGAARESAARAKSAALDPFHISVNLDCEDEPPKK